MKLDVSDSGPNRVFPLTLAASGERLRIAGLTAGKGLARRLADLGLPVGSEICVMHRQQSGSMVVSSGPTRMALGAGMVRKIMVIPA